MFNVRSVESVIPFCSDGEMMNKYWSGASEFIKRDANRLLPEMLGYDENNRNQISHNINLASVALDKAIAQFIAVLQKFYQNKDRWEDAQNSRAAIAMANSALNYHLLARHTVMLGYASETEPIYRACFERMTRCVVFQLDGKLSEKFWAGKEIRQKQIGDLLSKHFEDRVKGSREVANQRIKDMYKQLSQISHPNLSALRFRTIRPSNKTEREIVIDFSYCGENEEILKLISIGECMTYVIFSLFMLEIVSRKIFGSWANVLESRIEKLFEEHDELSLHIQRTVQNTGISFPSPMARTKS